MENCHFSRNILVLILALVVVKKGFLGHRNQFFLFPQNSTVQTNPHHHNSSSPKITATWIWPKHVKIHQDSFELVEFDDEFVGGEKTKLTEN